MLHTLARLFGIITILMSTVKALTNNSLGEVSNFKLFTIYSNSYNKLKGETRYIYHGI